RRTKVTTPATAPTAPTARRKAGALTSRAPSSGPLRGETASTASAPPRAAGRGVRATRRWGSAPPGHAERHPTGVEGGDQGHQPQPRRGGGPARRAGRTAVRLDDRDRAQQGGQGVLLVVHPGRAVAEPRAPHPVRRRGRGSVGRVRLPADGEPGYARRPLGQRLSDVGQAWIGPG